MRSPGQDVARITVSGDEVRGQGYVPLALALLHRTQERARLGGLAQLTARQNFDDTAYAIATIAGGINAVHIVAAALGETPGEEPIIPVDIPDFLSGTVQNGFIETVERESPLPPLKQLASFHPTLPCATRFKLDFVYQKPVRLVVEPHKDFLSDLKNPAESSPTVFSQYTRLKPTMFSGSMRALVQVLFGFGKAQQRRGKPFSIYDRPGTPQTKRTALTQFDKDTIKNGLQVDYDWRFSRTHGISYGADAAVWVVEISKANGILAMPLPIHPKTITQAFRDRMEKAVDAEALAILDQFGGFPTGEGFPPAEQIEAWIRAGFILRLATVDTMAPFYANSAYSEQMGWAFNRSGTEAHNTGWRYGADDVQRGVHYMVPLSIGAIQPRPAVGSTDALETAFAKLRSNASFKDIVDAAIWKLKRLNERQLEDAQLELDNFGAADALQQVDALELPGLAPASSHLSLVSEGTLWFPPNALKETGCVIRWPDLDLGLLVFHSLKPATSVAPEPKRCDTTMHVFFDGDELKWVKFYRDITSTPGTSTDNFEDCMYIGHWAQHVDGGVLAVPPMYYTNDLDDRAELPGSTTDMTITGVDLGYCRIVADDDIVNPSIGSASRTKRFRQTTDIKQVLSPAIVTGVAVPFYDREAYYYAVHRGNAGTSHTSGTADKELTDPWFCTYLRNFPGFFGQYVGSGTAQDPWRPLHLNDVNGYGPNEYRTADPDTPLYDDHNACRDIADSGPWCHAGDNIDAMLYSIPAPTLPDGISESTPATGHFDVYLVSSNGFGAIRTASADSLAFGQWDLPTPDTGDGSSSDQYIEATSSALGQSDSARFSNSLNSDTRVMGSPNWPGIESGYLTYVGVING